jgi:hypothetical protein
MNYKKIRGNSWKFVDKFKFQLICACVFLCSELAAQPAIDNTWTYAGPTCQLDWELKNDHARMTQPGNNQTFWRGGLLPSFWVEDGKGQRLFLKTEAVGITETNNAVTTIRLHIPEWADGSLTIEKTGWGVLFSEMKIAWKKEIPRIIEMYWGATTVDVKQQSMLADEQRPFTPNWDASGYCVPGAKEGPAQSFFRNWDFGHSHIALGTFGPSLGAPYGAAFPRPALFFAMGNDNGWISFGVGELPDAALTLKLQSGLGAMRYNYREDLWGPSESKEKTWNNPLKITFGKTAYEAFAQYFSSFPIKQGVPSVKHQKASWNTWGNWKERKYDIRPIVDFGLKVGAEVFVVDDPWASSKGSTDYNKKLFPHFEDDLKYIKDKGLGCGFWETLGWIEDTLACGLTKQDLICDKNGNPCLTSWNFNPLSRGLFFVDISSERARTYLKERTIREMQFFRPQVIKLDFGYGTPGPQMGVPKNPELRGERHAFELMKLISRAAKSVDPDVTILYYGISPIYQELVDIISLDDQGDLWYAIKEGHDQWSIWASLLSNSKVAITGSSSYEWDKDDEVILNSFILGSPNAVLGTQMHDGSPVPDRYLNRRLAINKWYRRTIQWEPEWINSHLGDLTYPQQLNCWGRVENKKLTALVLRGKKPDASEIVQSYEWDGRWAIISQDNQSINESSKIAIVPFDAGKIALKTASKPRKALAIGLKGESPANNWTWEQGVLVITINEEQLNHTAGYQIEF